MVQYTRHWVSSRFRLEQLAIVSITDRRWPGLVTDDAICLRHPSPAPASSRKQGLGGSRLLWRAWRGYAA